MVDNSHLPIEDMTESALWNSWATLKDYLSNMEDHLQKVTEQFEARVSDKTKTLTPGQFNEFMIDHVEEYIFYYDEFPYILRNSFFVSVYSLLEFDIDIVCRELKRTKEIPINLSDLYGDLLKRLKLYFKLAAVEYSFNNSKTWKEINKYSKLRNCIVHSNGLLKKDDKDYKALIEYVPKRGLIKERVIISGNVLEVELGLTKEFCKEVVDTMQKFIDAAYKESIRRPEK
jgi:hypothetical protein